MRTLLTTSTMLLSLSGLFVLLTGPEPVQAAVAGRNIAYFLRENTGADSPKSSPAPSPAPATMDLTGPGSVPLSEALENRIARYLLNDRCPSNRTEDINQRCQFLLMFQRQQEGQSHNGRLSPRSRDIVERVRLGETLRGTVNAAYRASITYTLSVLRLRTSEGGFVRRPRTLDDVAALKQEVQRARATRRSERESSVPLPIEEDSDETE